MMYFRWVLSFFVSFLLNLFLWVFADFVALLPATWKLENLPGFLWYLQTHDDNVYGSDFTNKPMSDRWWTRWRTAAWWLRRNPGYAFDALVLGLDEDVVRWKSEFFYTIGTKGFGYKRDWPAGRVPYLKIWIGWDHTPKGESGRHMLKIAFGPKFKEN